MALLFSTMALLRPVAGQLCLPAQTARDTFDHLRDLQQAAARRTRPNSQTLLVLRTVQLCL
jgi:hypothetical protein